jgi:hypothetical protein
MDNDMEDGYIAPDGGDFDVTGDPVLDRDGYQSPRRQPRQAQWGNPWLATAERERAERHRRRRQRDAACREATREAGGEIGAVGNVVLSGDQLLAHQAQAVVSGAPGRQPGWWAVSFDASGAAHWTKVDGPGCGPQVTAHGTAVRPVELTEPGSGTVVY